MHIENGAWPGHAGAVVEGNCLLRKSVFEGQCHLTILRRFSWPRIAMYICAERWNKMHSCIHVGQNFLFQWLFSNKISETHDMSSGHRGFRRHIVIYRSLYILYSLYSLYFIFILYSLYIIYSFKRSDFRSSGILEDRVTIHDTWVIIRDEKAMTMCQYQCRSMCGTPGVPAGSRDLRWTS